jgi:hypothetical protein
MYGQADMQTVSMKPLSRRALLRRKLKLRVDSNREPLGQASPGRPELSPANEWISRGMYQVSPSKEVILRKAVLGKMEGLFLRGLVSTEIPRTKTKIWGISRIDSG